MLDQSLHRFGPFLIIRTLGRGGMGEVFVAKTPWPNKPIAALKRLRPDVARVPTFAERFQHESELAVRLSHPNVVATLDVGSIDHQLYVASELILGKDTGLVADRLRESGQGGPAAVAIRLFVDVLHGLSYVHGVAEPDGRALKLVHRDVTPGNLLIGYDGVARLADFGLAKSLLTEGSNLTNHGEILGTPHYLAPEVIRGENAGPSADLYGIGAVMYRFLTGVAPHHGTTAEVLMKVLQEEPRPLSDLRPDLPPWLVSFVHRLLDKDPARRPGDAAQLGEQLIRDAKRADLFVARAQVGRWLINLFEVEHAEEIDEYERMCAYAMEDEEPPVEGTVVLARAAPASRLAMPTPDAFRRAEESGGTLLDLDEIEVRGAVAELQNHVEEDADMPTRAASFFPSAALRFDDGTNLERDEFARADGAVRGEDDTLDPDHAPRVRAADPANAATQWGEVVASPREPSTSENDAELPGFVDTHIRAPSDPGPRMRPRDPESVVVRPVVGSNPASRVVPAAGRSDEGSAAAPVITRTPPDDGRTRAVRELRGRTPVEAAPRPHGARPEPRPRTADRVQIQSRLAPPPARPKNLALAAGLLLLAVVLGVGIGTAVVTVKTKQMVPAPQATTERQALAQRFMRLKTQMEGRLAQGHDVPVRAQRLATDAATALLQEDEEAARLYLDEMERLLSAPAP